MPGRGRWFLIAAAGLLWLAITTPKLLQHASANTADLDTGNYHHLAWAIAHLGPAEGFASSVLTRHHLGEHCSPVMLLVALQYLVWPSAYVLMLLQATAVWATIWMTLLFAHHTLRHPERAQRVEGPRLEVVNDPERRPSTALGMTDGTRRIILAVFLAMLLVWPPLTATLATQFQPIELAAPLVALSLLLVHTRRTRWLWLTIPLLLSTRESAPLAVVGIGLYAGIGHRRWGLFGVLTTVAIAWLVIAMGVVMPYFRGGAEWGHTSYVDWSAAWDDKAEYLLVMLLGLGLFPYLGRHSLAATIGVIPGLLLNVSVARWTQYSFVGHYDAQTIPFLMIAAAHGLRALTTLNRTIALTVPSLALSLILWGIPGTKTVWQRLDDWWPSADRRATIAEAVEMAERYRNAPALTAHHRLGPHVAGRPNYVAERTGRTKEKWVWWISTRARPGHLFLIPREDNAFVKSGFPGQVRRSGSAVLIERGNCVELWQWPLDAPAHGNTEAARAYAAWLHAGDDDERSEYDP
ncbi:MAG: DUF2079 domain-containing protein [Planctomycetota bacterium]